MYKEYRFPTPNKAIAKQKQMKKEYGYKPEIFQIKTKSGQMWFSIVHPEGLIPINKKKGFDF